MKIMHDKMMAEIQKKQLSSEQLSVFKSSGTLGKKATKREKVKQAFYKEKLGLKLDKEEDEILHVKVEQPTAEPTSEEEQSGDMEESPNEPQEELATQNMESETHEMEEDLSLKGPTYMEEINEVIDSAPKGLQLRINDDSVEDLRRLKEDLETAVPEDLRKKAFFVEVNRTPEIMSVRRNLPVCSMEQEIMEAINYHDVVIICGETGSGKTTQVCLDNTRHL